MRTRVSLLVAAALLAGLAAVARADDDKLEVQRMRFIERGKNLTVTGTIAKLFDQAAYEALNSGFPSTILIGTGIYPRGSSGAIAVGTELRTVVYDLWDE